MKGKEDKRARKKKKGFYESEKRFNGVFLTTLPLAGALMGRRRARSSWTIAGRMTLSAAAR